MPADWQNRCRLFYVGDITAICPDVHDLAVSKCVAAREKDADFVRALLKHKMIELQTLLERIAQLDVKLPLDAIAAWARRRALEAQSS